jgi:hypothetical protein
MKGRGMADVQAIGSHNSRRLREFFAALPGRRLASLAIAGASASDFKFKLPIGEISIPGGIVRFFSKTYLKEIAARQWLNPNQPVLGLSDLPHIQSEYGFANGFKEFARDIQRHSEKLEQAHPQLALWIQRRNALLDFLLDPPKARSGHERGAQFLLHHRLIQLVSYLYALHPLDYVIALADELAAQALTDAGVETSQCLGTGPCHFNANLMMPIAFNISRDSLMSAKGAAAGHAREVWAACPLFDRCLIIAAETEDAGHLGFWVTLARGNQNQHLPGASSAFLNMEPNAVFKNDLPDLEGFPDQMDAAWKAYMQSHFHQDLFISLPFLVPLSAENPSGRKVAAVININIQSGDKRWKRAYHKEWLEEVMDRVSPLAEIAFFAIQVKVEAAKRSGGLKWEIDTGAETWNRLPGANVERLVAEQQIERHRQIKRGGTEE